MKNSFKQLSIRPGFMKHNGGILFRELSRKQYEFKVKIKKKPFKCSKYNSWRLYCFNN